MEKQGHNHGHGHGNCFFKNIHTFTNILNHALSWNKNVISSIAIFLEQMEKSGRDNKDHMVEVNTEETTDKRNMLNIKNELHV